METVRISLRNSSSSQKTLNNIENPNIFIKNTIYTTVTIVFFRPHKCELKKLKNHSN